MSDDDYVYDRPERWQWTKERLEDLLRRVKENKDKFNGKLAEEIVDFFVGAVMKAGWLERVPAENLYTDGEYLFDSILLRDHGINEDTWGSEEPKHTQYRGGRLEDMGHEKKYRIGSKDLSRALRWELDRQMNNDPPASSESNVQVAERIRSELRAVLIQRGLLKPESDYPSIDMLRRLVGKLR